MKGNHFGTEGTEIAEMKKKRSYPESNRDYRNFLKESESDVITVTLYNRCFTNR